MLFIPDLLSSLDLGQQIVVVAMLGLVVIYLFRSRKAASRLASTFDLAWFMAIAVVGSAAVAIYLGWVDPFPDAFREDVLSFGDAAVTILIEALNRLLDAIP